MDVNECSYKNAFSNNVVNEHNNSESNVHKRTVDLYKKLITQQKNIISVQESELTSLRERVRSSKPDYEAEILRLNSILINFEKELEICKLKHSRADTEDYESLLGEITRLKEENKYLNEKIAEFYMIFDRLKAFELEYRETLNTNEKLLADKQLATEKMRFINMLMKKILKSDSLKKIAEGIRVNNISECFPERSFEAEGPCDDHVTKELFENVKAIHRMIDNKQAVKPSSLLNKKFQTHISEDDLKRIQQEIIHLDDLLKKMSGMGSCVERLLVDKSTLVSVSQLLLDIAGKPNASGEVFPNERQVTLDYQEANTESPLRAKLDIINRVKQRSDVVWQTFNLAVVPGCSKSACHIDTLFLIKNFIDLMKSESGLGSYDVLGSENGFYGELLDFEKNELYKINHFVENLTKEYKENPQRSYQRTATSFQLLNHKIALLKQELTQIKKTLASFSFYLKNCLKFFGIFSQETSTFRNCWEESVDSKQREREKFIKVLTEIRTQVEGHQYKYSSLFSTLLANVKQLKKSVIREELTSFHSKNLENLNKERLEKTGDERVGKYSKSADVLGFKRSYRLRTLELKELNL